MIPKKEYAKLTMTKMLIEGSVIAANSVLPSFPRTHASVACIPANVQFNRITGMASLKTAIYEGVVSIWFFLWSDCFFKTNRDF